MEKRKSRKKRAQRVTRRRFLNATLGAMVSGGGAVGYAFGVEPDRVKVRRHDLKIADLPSAFVGARVVQLTDVHFQRENDHRLMRKVVEVVRSLDAELILHTGDYVAGDMKSLPALSPYFKEICKDRLSYAILGNHDVWHGSRGEFSRFFQSTGTELLVNENAIWERHGEALPIVGLDSAWGGAPDVERAFSGVGQSQAAITMMHEPDYFDKICLRQASLCQLSGHTHGGQCRIPLIKYAPVKVKYGEKYVDGDFCRSRRQNLFVSSGIGTTGMRVRFSCPPEVVLHTLCAT